MILRRLPSLPSWPMASAEMDLMRQGMERLFHTVAESTGERAAGVYPAVNLSADADSVIVRAELPGIDPKDLELTIENDTLTIAGDRAKTSDDGASCHRRERGWGKFRRSLPVPVHVDANDVRARYRDGILTITLAKAPQARPKQITVQAEA